MLNMATDREQEKKYGKKHFGSTDIHGPDYGNRPWGLSGISRITLCIGGQMAGSEADGRLGRHLGRNTVETEMPAVSSGTAGLLWKRVL